MNRALIVCKTSELNQSLTEIIQPLGFSQIETAISANDARQKLQYTDFDIVIINTPLSDEFGTNLIFDINYLSSCGIILLVKCELLDQLEAQIENTGTFVVGKPLNKQVLIQSIRFVLQSSRKLAELEEENKKLQKKLEDAKVINRAKFCLISYLNMTESQAHRYIQKQAMDLRVTPRHVAENIIKTYEM